MNKVTGINLNGNAYQLEEPGYAKLTAYLAQAREQLAGNPDQTEIMADLEQAIADKFQRFLSAHKSVVTENDVETVIKEMGPVDGERQENGEEQAAFRGPKRLYRIPEGEWVAGIANGVATYFDVDVTLIRIIFVLLTILTTGGFIFGYILGWVFIPVARTQEERAAARGIPFNAEELISRAKAEYAKLDGKRAEWNKRWSEWKKEQRRESRKREEWLRHTQWYGPRHHRPSAFGELLGIIVFCFFAWYGYHHVPVIHDFLDAAWSLWHRVADQLAQYISGQ